MSSRFGSDVMFDNGDILIDTSGDLFTTRDYDNLKSDSKFDGYYNMMFSLLDRLGTNKGDNPFHPEYGSNLQRILSSPNTPGFIDYVTSEISDTVLEDQRVRSVKSVNIEQVDNKIFANVTVELFETGLIVEFIFPNFVIQ